MGMFKKILIANRGEIACRVIETAQRMNIKTVAVYSDIDENARHVRMADEAVHIGGAASADSYLKADRIIQAAKDTNAQAIHPGYGFLSENADFAESCKKADVTFIGPSADAIRAMGLKDQAKDIMVKAGVPVVPGYQGEEQDPAFLEKQANEIGFPVLIKAVAGGGGKGMRRVDDPKSFKEDLASCQREAKASFANDHVLIEKYITKPRHIEIQVFGDTHGDAVHLFERDCSLQRRHQKVIEEAPAPDMPEDMRAEMGDAAVKAAKAISYSGACTVEFIVDVANGMENAEFFFMEMNTRLQVEHPVTEKITGHDLVEWQLRVAFGEHLPAKQDELTINGHSFETRLYAEDPANDFLPQTGRISHIEYDPSIRFDTGIEQGDSISIHYDPMVAKIITHGSDREEALSAMEEALRTLQIEGLTTNQEFLMNICKHETFKEGDVDTGFIPRFQDTLIPDAYGKAQPCDIALLALYHMMGLDQLDLLSAHMSQSPWDGHDNWRMCEGTLSQSFKFLLGGELVEFTAISNDREVNVTYNGESTTVTLEDFIYDGTLIARMNGEIIEGLFVSSYGQTTLFREAKTLCFKSASSSGDSDSAGHDGRMLAPMPGKIISVMVEQGENVDKDQPILIMEAMKIEITIRAGCAGTVEQLPVATNDQVTHGALLIDIQPKEKA
jgi:3-methylcrotonyl-CoA carboxylase alpha subunit